MPRRNFKSKPPATGARKSPRRDTASPRPQDISIATINKEIELELAPSPPFPLKAIYTLPHGKADASELSQTQIKFLQSISSPRFKDLDFSYCSDVFIWGLISVRATIGIDCSSEEIPFLQKSSYSKLIEYRDLSRRDRHILHQKSRDHLNQLHSSSEIKIGDS